MIGIFDSGVGGLSVVKELLRLSPETPFLYYGDTARVPYGNKSKETVERYAKEDADLLLSHSAQVVVVACNTASALALDELRKKVTVPLFNVVEPAVAKALQVSKSGKIGVIGTHATIESGVYQRLLKEARKDVNVFVNPAPLLVPLIEEHWMKRPETKKILRHYLRPLKLAEVDTLILACTHYPLLEKEIAGIMGKKVTVVNPSYEVAHTIVEYLKSHSELVTKNGDNKNNFYVSDDPTRFSRVATWWLGQAIRAEHV